MSTGPNPGVGQTWLVYHSGVTSEYSGDALTGAVARKLIPADALVWTQGMANWEHVSSLPAVRPAPASLAWLVTATIATAAVTIAFVYQLGDILDFATEYLGTIIAVLTVSFVVALLPILGISWAITAWQHPARRRASTRAGLILLIAVSAALYEVTQLVAFVMQVPDITRMLTALNSAQDAAIIPLGPGRVSVEGHIGPRLMRDYRRLETTHGPIHTVLLTSPGGLVEPALELARHLESQQTNVVVTRECSSACIPMAVASKRSIADADMSFGFHRTYPVVNPENHIVVYAYEQQWQEYRSFLETHGVPAQVLDEAAKHGPSSLYHVSALDMLAYGAIGDIHYENELPVGASK